jgi:8-oxo-dGTP diphosphatase
MVNKNNSVSLEKNMVNKERFKLIPSIYLILIKDNQILLLRRFQTGYEDGNYGLPAGHADGGETMKEAMAREALEEIGIRINKNDLELILTMHRWCGDHERMDLFFTIKNWEQEIRNMEPEKCDDLSWFSLDNLPKNVISYISNAIDCYKKGVRYCEFGWENKK